jgi:hypothetical protein
MEELLSSLRKYCMSANTFDEEGFKNTIRAVLERTPNATKLKMNLPFQVIGRASQTSTVLLANAFACIAGRPADFKPLTTFVIDHLSDSTLLRICSNPFDLRNGFKTFSSLKHLVMSIKTQESDPQKRVHFGLGLWRLIASAKNLESLCLIGWNLSKSTATRFRQANAVVDPNEWLMKSLPYAGLGPEHTLKKLRCLELKRINMEPGGLLALIGDHSKSLKELYLNEVNLKLTTLIPMQIQTEYGNGLWVGYAHENTPPYNCSIISERLRAMADLNLDVLRATNLGYDDKRPGPLDDYDSVDPTGYGRAYEQRFVEAAMGIPQPSTMTDGDSFGIVDNLHKEVTTTAGHRTTKIPKRPKHEYDVERFQRSHNTTSHWKNSIDGVFFNHNESALSELQKIIGIADRGMVIMSEELNRIHTWTNLTQTP